ncbi:MAG: WD40 repeat domain-containing serine/threonine protein kinase [Pseudomarimonas sp.]
MTAVDPAFTDEGQFDEPTQQISQWARLRRAAELNLDDPTDSRFGDYQLLEKIGTGGMGVVYRARQVSLDREVALKLLSFDPFSAEVLISRFRTEARHASQLQHPNIVPVYEIGSYENLYYFSMSLVRGPTLRQWLKRNPNPAPAVVASLMRTVAEAVQYAHQVGILHLDLKPGNVLIDERGEPQVSDFGLARRVGEAAEGAGDTVVAGTPAYMAPEQSKGDPRQLSAATDVWGLGGILYALLTGQPPLDEAAESTELRWQVEPARTRGVAVAADLDAICNKCLQRDPADRYASARALADDLQRFLDGRPVSVRHQAPWERLRGWARREPRAAVLAAGLLLALLSGLAGTTVLWLQSDASRTLAQSTLWDARRATALAAAERGDALAGLPGLVANVAEAEATDSAADIEVDRRRIRLMLEASPRQISSWTFADEGRSLAFAEGGDLLLAGLRGGDVVALEVEGRGERWRIRPPIPPTPWGPSFVGRMLPAADGRHMLLFPSGSSGVARPDTSFMHRVDLRDGTLTAPPAAFKDATAITYSFDGKRALLRDSRHGMQVWSVDPWQAVGKYFPHAAVGNCLLIPDRDQMACADQGFSKVSLLGLEGPDPSDDARTTFSFADGTELSSWNVDVSGRWLALGSAGGELQLHDLQLGQRHSVLDAGELALGDLSFSGSVLAVSSNGGSVRLFDLQQRRWLSRPLRSGGERIGASIYDASSHWLLANDGRAVLWRLLEDAGRLLQSPATSVLRHRGTIAGYHATALHAGRALLATQGSEGEVKLFRLPSTGFAEQGEDALVGDPGALVADRQGRTTSNRLILAATDTQPASEVGLPEHPNLLAGTADGRYWAMAAGRKLLVVDSHASMSTGSVSELELPASAQFLLVPSGRAVAHVGWISEHGALQIWWRTVDLASKRWLAAPTQTEGLPAGLRMAASGRYIAHWQGRVVELRHIDDGRLLASLTIDGERLNVSDVNFAGADDSELLIASSDRSLILPASIEHRRWNESGEVSQLAVVATPSAHIRIFDIGYGWLAHGPRPAIYSQGKRYELTDLGVEWGEAVALSPDRRWAALGEADAFRLFDLHKRQPLEARRELGLLSTDSLASLAFSANGERIHARSHFGYLSALRITSDPRPLLSLQHESEDLVPSRDQLTVAASVAERQTRDPGLPIASAANARLSSARHPHAAAAQIDLRDHANVPERQWFQGSRRGLGITDSASWPRGLLRLRGIDFELGPAIQLAPQGMALGAASFASRSGPIALPTKTVKALSLLITNQQVAKADGLRLAWLNAKGEVIAEQTLDVPTTYDGDIHSAKRNHQPRADVALVLRSAESRLRGGGSQQLLVYLIRVDAPDTEQVVTAVELRAPGATPLLLALTAH